MLTEEVAEDIVAVGVNKQSEEKDHPGNLRVFEKFFVRFASRHHLVDQEHDMSAVQCGDGKNVHKCQDDAQESRLHPEHLPVPFGREKAAERPEEAPSFVKTYFISLT